MTKKDLMKKIAQLESYVDQMETEIVYVNELLQMIGFQEGLSSIKRAAQEIAAKTGAQKPQGGLA